jgi:hypothetical protein
VLKESVKITTVWLYWDKNSWWIWKNYRIYGKSRREIKKPKRKVKGKMYLEIELEI